jgi:hypothetical protein
VLAIVLVADKQRPFLDESEFREVADGLVAYCEGERDLRGFVPGRGWAHAVAHAADEVFQAEEDARIGIAVAAMLSTGRLTASRLRAFLDERELSDRAYRTNWKHILRSTYLRLDVEHANARGELEEAQAQLALRP